MARQGAQEARGRASGRFRLLPTFRTRIALPGAPGGPCGGIPRAAFGPNLPWDRWRDPHSGKALETFTIITVAANELVQPVHDRMPLILFPAAFDAWLAHGEPADDLLQLPATDELEAVPVSCRVNSPAHDDARCMERAPVVNKN